MKNHEPTTINVLEVKQDEHKLKENKSGDSEGYSESFEYDSEKEMEGSEGEDESSESEEDIKVDTDKTPFALLKSLHGIMNIASSSSRLAMRSNKVGITDQEKEDTSDQSSSKIVKN